MKKGKSVLTRQVLAGLLAGVLLGSVGYVQPAAAAGVDIVIDTQEKYENADSSIKDGDGNIKPIASTAGNKVTIGTVGYGNEPFIGSSGGGVNNVYGGYSEGSADAVNNQVYINSGKMNFVESGFSVNGDAIGNSVVVSGGTIGGILSGGSSATGKSAGNSVIISGGAIGSDAGGGVSNKGEVTGNSVTVSGGTVGLNVYGGISMDGTVTGNSVIISGGTIGKDQDTGKVYGGFSNSGAVTGNVVTVSGGIIHGNVSGGWSNEDGAVTGNSVTVSGGKIGKDVYGGYSKEGTVTGNNVTISNGKVNQTVSGGKSDSGTVTGNRVTISGGEVGVSAYGGYSNSGAVTGNVVTVSGGIICGAYGGNSSSGAVIGNSVAVSGGTISGNVYGGYSYSDTATGNSVAISGGTISGDVYGGQSISGNITGNSVTISGDITVWFNVYGGYSINSSGTVTGNSVIISGGEIKNNVYGGYSNGGGAVMGNGVVISGGTIKGDVNGGVSISGAIIGNIVVISSGDIYGKVRGGYGSSGTVTGNIVTISDCKIYDSVYGGENSSGAVTGNSVTISDGTTVDYSVYGGYTTSGAVTGNSIAISGSTISGNVYGGYSNNNGAVTDNNVTISGNPKFGTSTVLYGGVSSGQVSGNRLNIHTKGLEAGNVKNFDEYNFYLADEVQKDALLTLTGGMYTEVTNISNSAVNLGMAGALNALKTGDTITLIANSNGITATTGMTYGQQMLQGVSIVYDVTTGLDQEGKKLVTTIKGGKATAQSKSPVETQLAAAAFINSGADLLAGSGISSSVTAAGGGNAEIFGAMSGGSMRYETGSHADVHGYNLALGVGKAVANKAGQLTYGPFIEYGHGNYTSYLDSGVRGDGNTKYCGIGMLARQDNNNGVYYEGSLRYGRMDADYASGDMVSALGKVRTEYDSSSAYYGAHFGVGKVTELNDTTKADVYAKLLYTHQKGDRVALQGAGAGEVYDFEAVDSARARIGARLSKDYGQRGSGYVGIAYEYEFDGEARATVKGFSTPSPSIKGSSGLLELGYILQPKSANDPAINIGLQGWGGKKQGVTGNVNFVWTF
ncbi:autotransporter domain-containing protein [Phascolarctobacterium sp.]